MKKIMIAVLLTLSGCTELKTEFTTFEAGQIWEFCPNERDNPFETVECKQYTVLAVKNGYVRYSDKYGNIDSDTEHWFKIGSRKIK